MEFLIFFPLALEFSSATLFPVQCRPHLVYVARAVIAVIVVPLLLAPLHRIQVPALEGHAVLDHPWPQHSNCYLSLKFKETSSEMSQDLAKSSMLTFC